MIRLQSCSTHSRVLFRELLLRHLLVFWRLALLLQPLSCVLEAFRRCLTLLSQALRRYSRRATLRSSDSY